MANTSQVDENANPITLLGVIDLLIVDKDYNCHFIDYKTSDKPYSEFYDAKKLTYSYQFGIYERLLRANDIEMARDHVVSVAPIQMSDFYRDDDNKWHYRRVKWEGVEYKNVVDPNRVLRDITEETLGNLSIIKNLEMFLPANIKKTIVGKDLQEKTSAFMSSCFSICEDSEKTDDATIQFLYKKQNSKS